MLFWTYSIYNYSGVLSVACSAASSSSVNVDGIQPSTFVIFDWNRRLSWKRYVEGLWILWNFSRQSEVADWSASVLMILT